MGFCGTDDISSNKDLFVLWHCSVTGEIVLCFMKLCISVTKSYLTQSAGALPFFPVLLQTPGSTISQVLLSSTRRQRSWASSPASQAHHCTPPQSLSYLAKLQSPAPLGAFLVFSLPPLSTTYHKHHVGSVILFLSHYLYT